MVIEPNNGRLIEIHNFVEPLITGEFVVTVRSESSGKANGSVQSRWKLGALDDRAKHHTVAAFAVRNHLLPLLHIGQKDRKER